MNEDIKGYRPSMSEACRAKCFDCMDNFGDGRRDCRVYACPLYTRMPFRKTNRIDYSWVFGRWARNNIVLAEELGTTDPRKFAMLKWGKNGKIRIPMSKMIRAKCFGCNGDYIQPGLEKGRVDCGVPDCPLYFWTPYRSQFPCYDWMFNLDHTKKHRIAMLALRLTQDEYVYRLLEARDL